MRRGEVPFVAIRVGRSNDPREVLGLARELRVQRAAALGFLALWEELILEVGDARSGRVHGYSAEHLAAKLGWEGPPRRLIDALKRAGVLTTHRGVLVHPYWSRSTTGIYARMRAERREEWRLKKRAQREADGAGDVPGDVSGTNGGPPHGVPQKVQIDRSIDRGDRGSAPPFPPAGGGGGPGSARWDWMRAHHKRPRNSAACIRLLDAMTEENWALCQWVVQMAAGGWPRSLSRKKRVGTLDSHRFLATEAFLELLPEWREKQEADQRPPRERSNVERPDDVREVAGIAFVLAQLADADLSDAEKNRIRDRWTKLHPDNPTPWLPPAAAAG
jgi:hypothetical protein